MAVPGMAATPPLPAPLVAAVIAAWPLAAVRLRRPAAGGSAVAALLLLALAAGAGWRRDLASRPAVTAPDRWSPAHRVTWEGPLALRVTGWPRRRGDRWRVPARIVAVGDGERRPDTPAAVVPTPRPGEGVLLAGAGPEPQPGQRLLGRVRLSPPRGPALPGGFSSRRFLLGRAVAWDGRLRSGWAAPARRDALERWLAGDLAAARRAVRRTLARLLPPREAALDAGVLLGVRDGDGEERRRWTDLGLGHLFAVSGLHVGLLAVIVLRLAGTAGRRPGWRLALLAGLLLPFLALTGAAASTTRAVGMVLLLALAGVAGRDADVLRLLGLLLWANWVVRPAAVLDAGLQLSYLAVAGIVLTHRLTRRLTAGTGRRRWRPVEAAAVTLGAQWGTLPVVAGAFGWLHAAAPLLNLVAVPLFGLVVWAAALALLAAAAGGVAPVGSPWRIVWEHAARDLAAWNWLGWRLLGAGVGWWRAQTAALTVGLPPWGVGRWGVYLLASGGLAALGRWGGGPGRDRGVGGKRRRLALPLALAVATALPPALGAWRAPGRMTVLQLDVGQGDAALFRFPGGDAVLVDAGPPGGSGVPPLARVLEPWCRRHGVRHLAGVVLTHDHADHTGGAGWLARRLPPRWWWLGGRCAADSGLRRRLVAGRPVVPRAGDLLHAAGGWTLACVALDTARPRENDRSLVVELRGPATGGLWTADLETTAEELLLPGRPLPVLKAGHHGSRTSSGPALLAARRPRLVLVSCGVANRYGHPSHGPFTAGDTLPVARTDLDGSILLAWDAGGALRWRTARGGGGALPARPGAPAAPLDTGGGPAYRAAGERPP